MRIDNMFIGVEANERVEMDFECKKCKKTFSNKSNLKEHVLKFHPLEINNLVPEDTAGYKLVKFYKRHVSILHKLFAH